MSNFADQEIGSLPYKTFNLHTALKPLDAVWLRC